MTEPVEKHHCEHCGTERAVLYDRLLKLWLCHWCWVRTPIPKPPKRP